MTADQRSAEDLRIAMQVEKMPAEQPGVTLTPESTLIPAPTATHVSEGVSVLSN